MKKKPDTRAFLPGKKKSPAEVSSHTNVQPRQAARTIVLFRRCNRPLQISLFFALFFFFILYHVLPGLFTVFNGVFRYSYIVELTKGYAASVFFVPGQISTALVAWFVLSCRVPWLGALILTFASGCLFTAIFAFCKSANIRSAFFTFFIPCLFFLAAIFQYNAQYFPFIIALIGTTALACVYQHVTVRNNFYRSIVLFGLSCVSYYLFSTPGFFFCALAIINDGFSKRKSVLYTAGASVATVGAILLFKTAYFPFDRSYPLQWLFDFAKPIPYLFAFIPVLAVQNALSSVILRPIKKTARVASTQRLPFAAELANVVMATVITVFTLSFATTDIPTKTLRELGKTLYYVKYEQWENVLSLRNSFVFDGFPKHHSNTQLMISSALYRALFHTGLLGSDMLSFPQVCDPEPLILKESAFTVYFPAWVLGAEVGVDLGLSLFAEKVCGEAMENMGPHPSLCLLRSQIQISRGNETCAETYLNKVKNLPGYGTMAGSLLRTLQRRESFPDTGTIGRLKSSLEKDSLVLDHASPADLLQSTLKSNPKNKMAFEYLMAYYLLTRQLGNAAQNLYRLDDLGYAKIPPLYEQAFVIYQKTAPDSARMVKLPRLPLSKTAFDDCDRFLHTLDAYSHYGEPQKAMRAEFGTSYYYLYTFGIIPPVQS